MLKKFSASLREENLQKLQSDYFDVLIIGGGINGAGIARDAASRGMKVALVEANDFASGTSSRSSKLVHGGIRYLENLEFSLVFEALSERAKLFQIAPNLVHPLRFVLPIYKGARVGMMKMGLGMALYDLLSLYQAPKLHERLSKEETLRRLPILDSENLRGAYEYSDAYMDDDRLVHETLRSANHQEATIANYVKVTQGFLENEKLYAVEVEDCLSGGKFQIKAKHFIGGTGPWTDIFGESVMPEWQKVLRPTKGVHLTFSRERLPLSRAIVMFSNDQKRIVFGIPRHEMTIIGTTDTDYSTNPRSVKAEKEDVDYLLKVIDQHFPGAKIQAKDILSSYAGVRPLVQDGSNSEGKTSREHQIWLDSRNITFVAGGKYTTYRLIAKQTMEQALEAYDIEDQGNFAHSQTGEIMNPLVSNEHIEKAESLLDTWANECEIGRADIQMLIDRHGMEAEEIIDSYADEYPHLWQMEAKHAIKTTMCLNLKDFYFRRVPLFLAKPDHGLADLDAIARVFQEDLGWSDAQTISQKESLLKSIQAELAWQKNF